MDAKLYRVIIQVSDIEAAVTFYSQVFEQAGERVSPGRHYFNCDGVILACVDPAADGDDHAPVQILITFILRSSIWKSSTSGLVAWVASGWSRQLTFGRGASAASTREILSAIHCASLMRRPSFPVACWVQRMAEGDRGVARCC
jgi:hypothetical protein